MKRGHAEQVENQVDNKARNRTEISGPFSLNHVASLADRAWLQKVVYRLFGLDKLDQLYKSLPRTNSAHSFIQAILVEQNVGVTLNRHTVENLDNLSKGPLLVIANHPFGMIEGLLLMNFLLEYRTDVKLLANKFLERVPELADILFSVLPFSDTAAITKNRQSTRQAINWLSAGHCMACFPAGNVSRLQLPTFKIADDAWSDHVIRIARAGQANILPVYFEGRNGLLFQLLGLFGPKMHSLLYVREFLKKRGVSIKMQVGEVIPFEVLDELEPKEALRIVRSAVYAQDLGQVDQLGLGK